MKEVNSSSISTVLSNVAATPSENTPSRDFGTGDANIKDTMSKIPDEHCKPITSRDAKVPANDPKVPANDPKVLANDAKALDKKARDILYGKESSTINKIIDKVAFGVVRSAMKVSKLLPHSLKTNFVAGGIKLVYSMMDDCKPCKC